ncbi:MAG: hypothetical protein Q4Q58_01195 [Thermoplasmata archaeon]|nr:hypothetical protein [Thermoplasmata archaeon]
MVPRGSSSCQTLSLPSLTRWSTETNVVRFSLRSPVYRSLMSICPVPSLSILDQTASTSRSSSSSWALLSNLAGSFALSSLRTLSRSLWISISLRASSNASMSSYTVTGRSVCLWKASLKLTSGTKSESSS